MAKIYLICGKICSGKSYYYKKLKEKVSGVILSPDEATYDLIKNERGEFYNVFCDRLLKYLNKKAVEIVENPKSKLSLDLDKIAEEEKFDGYYAIVSSELDKTDEEIIDIYRELWKIEETFKITKSELETRPVYVSRKEHIEAHFLICFIALTLARMLQHRLNGKYSVSQILESLQKCNCSHIQENYWLFNYTDDILSDIGTELNINFSQKFRQLQDIKKILADTKNMS